MLEKASSEVNVVVATSRVEGFDGETKEDESSFLHEKIKDRAKRDRRWIFLRCIQF
ncbi:hypothetical protein [Mucilaginibacter agri]|uniref:Uncharacterized protein n=1 Tax=Mucilaginibacter agri TaxID=2695265 RepID=A0A966DV22_9SPHI|nr:hypothetical protein [Mucilaginibacter agri]NCD72400.1 hypothetical protein [Mucilaginibacter agri]